MNKTLKRIVLMSLFALFFIIGGITIFYAQGYRFDMTSLSLKKVGAIFIKTIPGGAAVTIDGEPVDKKYWLFNSGKLVQSLFPKDYKIVVSYPNYQTLNLNITVAPSLVSELSHILLIPEKNESIINEVYSTEGAISNDFPLTKAVNQNLYLAGSKIGKYAPIAVSADGQNLLANNKAGLYYFRKEKSGAISQSTSTITLYPENANYFLNEKSQGIISFTSNKIYRLEEKAKPVLIYSSTSTITSISDRLNKIAWSEKQEAGEILGIYNKSNNSAEKILIEDKINISKLEWQADDQILIQSISGDIFLYSLGNRSIHKLTSETIIVEASADSKRTAMVGKERLEIFMENGKYLRSDISTLGTPEKLSWLEDSSHLIYKASGKVYLIDIETPLAQNFQQIGPADNFWYDIVENAIYLHQGSNLERIRLEN